MPFKVIQGHRGWYQLKARMHTVGRGDKAATKRQTTNNTWN